VQGYEGRERKRGVRKEIGYGQNPVIPVTVHVTTIPSMIYEASITTNPVTNPVTIP